MELDSPLGGRPSVDGRRVSGKPLRPARVQCTRPRCSIESFHEIFHSFFGQVWPGWPARLCSPGRKRGGGGEGLAGRRKCRGGSAESVEISSKPAAGSNRPGRPYPGGRTQIPGRVDARKSPRFGARNDSRDLPRQDTSGAANTLPARACSAGRPGRVACSRTKRTESSSPGRKPVFRLTAYGSFARILPFMSFHEIERVGR
jgi:hypothetical protein